jgi:hypothetical protein
MGDALQTSSAMQLTTKDYENFFGPAGRDVKIDQERNKRTQRLHPNMVKLPPSLQGSNNFIADQIDGLITDTSNSPFTGFILPYRYLENPDQKIKWYAYSYDEAMASRVPYETSARVLTQTKTSYAGYATRHGLAIKMEHNFMASEAGRRDYYNQLKQLVGSIQYTNDYEVHMALITAESHARKMKEKYYHPDKNLNQVMRQYVDLYGILQKTPNALDIVIEDAKAVMRQWGSANPTFLMCNSKLCMQLQMSPERTQFITQGPDGIKRLREGPNIQSYRGLKIVNSRAFSLETGMPPRDIMRRRVRVAEHYWIPAHTNNKRRRFHFYDESKDSFVSFSWWQLFDMATGTNIGTEYEKLLMDDSDRFKANKDLLEAFPMDEYELAAFITGVTILRNSTTVSQDIKSKVLKENIPLFAKHIIESKTNWGTNNGLNVDAKNFGFTTSTDLNAAFELARVEIAKLNDVNNTAGLPYLSGKVTPWTTDLLIVRPNIEHNMHGIIMGRGGMEDLGCTFWGQTELSCADDNIYGVWSQQYKYHAKAMVFNQKNMIRVWDVAFDGYNGGHDTSYVDWGKPDSVADFIRDTRNNHIAYDGLSMVCMAFDRTAKNDLPNPLMWYERDDTIGTFFLDPENIYDYDSKKIQSMRFSQLLEPTKRDRFYAYADKLPDFHALHTNRKGAGLASQSDEAQPACVSFQGQLRVYNDNGLEYEINGSGHLGQSYVGVASVREGKGFRSAGGPSLQRII